MVFQDAGVASLVSSKSCSENVVVRVSRGENQSVYVLSDGGGEHGRRWRLAENNAVFDRIFRAAEGNAKGMEDLQPRMPFKTSRRQGGALPSARRPACGPATQGRNGGDRHGTAEEQIDSPNRVRQSGGVTYI
jgi:hypothetical protein